MLSSSITQAFFYGLLASAPLAAAFGGDGGVFKAEKRHVVSRLFVISAYD